MSWKTKRTKPYLQESITRQPCIRCGKPGHAQWQICADKGYFRVLCKACDIALNRLVLKWAKHPHAEQVATQYAEKLNDK